MNFLMGILVGCLLSGILVAIALLNKIQNSLVDMSADVLQLNKATQLHAIKLNKLEQMSQITMGAAENFVDALQQSTRDMHMRLPPEGPDDFQDLRDSFEGGIRNLENEPDDDEENWKK